MKVLATTQLLRVSAATASRLSPTGRAVYGSRAASSSATSSQQQQQQQESSSSSRQPHNEAPQPELTGADKLLADALAEEAEELAIMSAKAARNKRDAAITDRAWDGDELVQDTILRMLMDKHKPLRVKSSNAIHPADAKLSTIQKPALKPHLVVEPAPPSFRLDFDTLPPKSDDGRRLAKTPDDAPWLAQYVNPTTLRNDSEEGAVYRARSVPTSSSAGRKKLATAALPYDDPKAMRRLRDEARRAEKTGRLSRARESTLDYRLGLRRDTEGRAKAAAVAGSRAGGGSYDAGMEELSEEEQKLLNPDWQPELDNRSEREKDEEQVYAGGGGGYAGIVDERIKEAIRAGAFRTNSLRGQLLERDIEESNPYLSREEQLMNRLIKRQGAAPPFVEVNMEVEESHSAFRTRLLDSWIRRSTRLLLSRPGMAAKIRQTGSVPEHMDERLRSDIENYRDPEWEVSERLYHEASVKDINNKIRKYNTLAPFTARRPLATVEDELARCYRRAGSMLVQSLMDEVASPTALASAFTLQRKGLHVEPTGRFDLWGRDASADIREGSGVGGAGAVPGKVWVGGRLEEEVREKKRKGESWTQYLKRLFSDD